MFSLCKYIYTFQFGELWLHFHQRYTHRNNNLVSASRQSDWNRHILDIISTYLCFFIIAEFTGCFYVDFILNKKQHKNFMLIFYISLSIALRIRNTITFSCENKLKFNIIYIYFKSVRYFENLLKLVSYSFQFSAHNK